MNVLNRRSHLWVLLALFFLLNLPNTSPLHAQTIPPLPIETPVVESSDAATATATETISVPVEPSTATVEIPATATATISATVELPTATPTATVEIPATATETISATVELPTATPLPAQTEPALTATPAEEPLMTSMAEAEVFAQGALMEEISLSVTQSSSFVVLLNGLDQVADAAIAILVGDTRTESSGWNLQAAATQFVDPLTARVIPSSGLLIASVMAECFQQPCTLPVDTVHGGTVAFSAGAMDAVKFFNAAPESGSGELTITPTFRLQVPANTYAGVYESTIVITLVSGP